MIFFLCHIEIEGKSGWIIGGGPKGMLPKLLGDIYYYFTIQLGTFVIFFLFHIEIEGKSGWIIGGGGPKGMLPKLLGGLPPPPPAPPPPPPAPLPTPMHAASIGTPSADSRRAVVSYWRKYVHPVLVNRLGGLSLPRKGVVRLTDRPDMTLDVSR